MSEALRQSDEDLLAAVRRDLETRRAAGERLVLGEVLDRYPEVLTRVELLGRLLVLLDEVRGLRAGTTGAGRERGAGPGTGDAAAAEGAVREAAVPATPPAPGGAAAGVPPERREIGDFRLLRELGQGGMGTVFLAVQKSISRLVAVKILPPYFSWRPGQVERFRREVEAAGRLDNDHVARVFTAGEHEGRLFYAMEYVDGVTLRELAAEERASLAPGGAGSSATGARRRGFLLKYLGYVVQAARALHAVHEAGIVHRDIKPDNLLVDTRGVLKIVDFGLARLEGDTTVTRTGAVPGTPLYTSPELLRPGARATRLSDVYSLGIVLYEIVAGRPPWRGETPLELYREALEAEPPPPCKLDPSVPRDLETIIFKAIEKSPQARYQSALELAEDLERFLRFEPVRARRSGPLERAWKFARRHRALAAGAAAAAALLLAGALWWYLRPAQVVVGGTPGAAIEFLKDGELVCSVTAGQGGGTRVELPSGTYTVRAALGGHREEERSVHLDRGSNPPVLFILRRALGFQRLESGQDEVTVRVEDASGRSLQSLVAPTIQPVALAPGRYHLVSEKAGFWRAHEDVEIHLESEARLRARVAPLFSLWKITRAKTRWLGEGVFVDLDGDGTREVLVGTRGGGDAIVALSARSGEEVRAFATRGLVTATLAASDLDGDGRLELFAGTWENHVCCYDAAGALRWEDRSPQRFLARPLLADLDEDGALEVLAADMAGHVSCWSAGGKLLWRRALDAAVRAERALEIAASGFPGGPGVLAAGADGSLRLLGTDGTPAGVLRLASGALTGISAWARPTSGGSPERAYLLGSEDGAVLCLEARGEVAWTFRVPQEERAAAPGEGQWVAGAAVRGAPAAGDMDGDGASEVVFTTARGVLWCLDGSGRERWRRKIAAELRSAPLLADTDGDGRLEAIAAGPDGHVYHVPGGGERHWSVKLPDRFEGTVAAADLDGDRRDDLVLGSSAGTLEAFGLWNLTWSLPLTHNPGRVARVVRAAGHVQVVVTSWSGAVIGVGPEGGRLWEFRTGGGVPGGVTLADVDGDGRSEVLLGSWDGRVYCLRVEGAGVRSLWREGDREGVPVGGPVFTAPVVTDLEGDGGLDVLVGDTLEVVVADRLEWVRRLHCLDARGGRRWRVEALGEHEDSRFMVLAAADLDGDGVEEVLVEDGMTGLHCFGRPRDGKVWELAWRREGVRRWCTARVPAPVPAREGARERARVLVEGEDGLAWIDREGEARWLRRERRKASSPAPRVADVDGDSTWEVLLAASAGRLLCAGLDGEERWSYEMPLLQEDGVPMASSPCVADFDGDGRLEVLVVGSDGLARFLDAASGRLLGSMIAPVYQTQLIETGDVDGDGRLEFIGAGEREVRCFRAPPVLR